LIGCNNDLEAFTLFLDVIKKCPNCGGEVNVVSSSDFFKNSSYDGVCYVCSKCFSYCNTVRGTNVPLGLISNPLLKNHHKMIFNLYKKLESAGEDTASLNLEICDELEIDGLSRCRINFLNLVDCRKVEKRLQTILSRYEDIGCESGVFEIFL
jgi:hypothetical protein